MVENMMLTALIDSPRFSDYKIYSVETDPGLIKMIDDEMGQSQGFGKKPPGLRSPAQVAAQFRAFMNNAGAAPAAETAVPANAAPIIAISTPVPMFRLLHKFHKRSLLDTKLDRSSILKAHPAHPSKGNLMA